MTADRVAVYRKAAETVRRLAWAYEVLAKPDAFRPMYYRPYALELGPDGEPHFRPGTAIFYMSHPASDECRRAIKVLHCWHMHLPLPPE